MNSATGFNQRLREYILKKHGSVNAFCRATGIKYPAQMTPYLMGKCLPGKKMIERLEKDGADIRWLQNGSANGGARAPLSNTLALSRYRMDVDHLFRQVHLHHGGGAELYKPAIDAYAVIDYNERIVDLTGSIERFLEYEKNALSGVELTQLIHPDDYAPVKSALQIHRFEDDIVSFNSRFKKGDGSYLNVEWCLYIKRIPMSDLNEYALILRRSDN
jgi:PAS domain S-box-containing protein